MDRRLILSLMAGALALPRIARAMPVPQPRRRLRLVHMHTGETFDGTYRDDTGPLADAMADLSVFLRDFHTAAKIKIDVAIIDFLAAVMDAIDARSASVLSAYRTPETNAKLARTTFGVAENSQHLYGRAIDVHFGARLGDAMQAARSMHRGGVGWYPHSGFLHIDTGPVRYWELDGSRFDTLLASRRRGRPYDKVADSKHYSPELKRSGLVRSEMEQSGRIRSDIERSTRPLAEMARNHRLR